MQALVTPASFGNPRRLAAGFDLNRLLLILAVLERKLGLPLGSKDVYLNLAGGMRIDDPAADLAVAAAVASSLRDIPIEEGLLLTGELGLLGEIRSVGQMARRCREAAAFGFSAVLCPPEVQEQAGDKLRRLPAADLETAFLILGLTRAQDTAKTKNNH